jgi:hypothetical protein
MASFDAEDFLLVRDLTAGQDAVERAATLLGVAWPESRAEELRALALGRRNVQLLELRERLFGRQLEAFADCPNCDESLEFVLSTDALRAMSTNEPAPAELLLETEYGALRFRLIDSGDLSAASQCASVAEARALLVERCVIEASGELSEGVIERLAEAMAANDPLAETLIDLTCPACKETWQIAFDIATFLDSEIDAAARALLREVHMLARAYGWSEAEILSLPPRRRRDYLELLLQ